MKKRWEFYAPENTTFGQIQLLSDNVENLKEAISKVVVSYIVFFLRYTRK